MTDTRAMQRSYATWAKFYDAVYVKLLLPGQRASIAAALAAGPRVLEVGVGTGLSLEHYPPGARVTGIDLSPDMLAKAQEKVARKNLTQVEALTVMDATKLDFPDGSFDAAVALYMITLVPDPERTLTEMARVVRPGGAIVVATHFGQESGAVARLETMLAGATRSVGWSSDFKLSRVRRWAESTGLARFEGVEGMPPLGFFKVARFQRS